MSAAYNAVAVTPSDTVDIAFADGLNDARYLYVGVSGDVTLITPAGNTVLFKAHPVGYLLCRCSRVKSTGTTATNMIALK